MPSKTLERSLRHTNKRPVQFFLIIALSRRNTRDDRLGRDGGNGKVDWLGCVEGHVAIFIIVYVDLDLAIDGGRGGRGDRDLVDSSESAIPGLNASGE